jgi:hypothetical protein
MAGKKIKIGNIPRRNGKAQFNLIGPFKSIKWTKRTRLFLLIGIVVILLISFSFRGVSADVMTKSCAGTKGVCNEESYPVSTGKVSNFKLSFIDSKTKKEIANPTITAKISVSNCYAKGVLGHPNGGCLLESNTDNFTGNDRSTTLYQMEKKTYKDGVLSGSTVVYFPGYKSNANKNASYSQWRSAVYSTTDSGGKNLSITVKSPFTYTVSQSRAEAAIETLDGRIFTNNVSSVASAISSSKAKTTVSGKITNAIDATKLTSCKGKISRNAKRLTTSLNAKETEQNLGFWATFGEKYFNKDKSKIVTVRSQLKSIDPSLGSADIMSKEAVNVLGKVNDLALCNVLLTYTNDINISVYKALRVYATKKGVEAVKAEAKIVKARNITAIAMVAIVVAASGGYALSAAPSALSPLALEYAGGAQAVRVVSIKVLPRVIRALPQEKALLMLK